MMKLETETEVRSKNTPAITDYAIGAAKENEMKIFEIIILKKNTKNILSSPEMFETQKCFRPQFHP